MRRLLFITAFALFVSLPIWAQRGGHSAGFGGHASFGGGHVGFSGHSFSGGHMGGGHFSPGMRGGFVRGSMPQASRGFSHAPNGHNGFHSGFHDHNHFHGHFHNHAFVRNCFGWRCAGGVPFWGAYYDPWLWNWDYDDARFDADYYNNLAQANEMNQQSLEEQRMLRQEQADRDQDLYRPNTARASYAPVPESSQQGTPIVASTVLVFRDHHQQEIQNYAIVGQTLWIFASPHTHKVPLSELDIAATIKANDDRGVTFQPPAVSEGQ